MPKIDPPVSFSDQTQLVFDPVGECWKTCLVVGGSPVDDNNPLPVILNANITIDGNDIKIGAVELQDQNTGVRADIESLFDFGVLLTYDGIEYQKVRFEIFGENTVSKGNTLTLVTKTISSGKEFRATGVIIGGGKAGIFRLNIDGVDKAKFRNSGSIPTQPFKFVEEFIVDATKTVYVNCENIDVKDGNFEVTLFGYEVNV